MVGRNDPPALAACPVCSETWWMVRQSMQIAAANLPTEAAGRAGVQPEAVERRVAVLCANCGYSPP